MHGSLVHSGDVIVIQGNPGSGKPTLTMVAIKALRKIPSDVQTGSIKNIQFDCQPHEKTLIEHVINT